MESQNLRHNDVVFGGVQENQEEIVRPADLPNVGRVQDQLVRHRQQPAQIRQHPPPNRQHLPLNRHQPARHHQHPPLNRQQAARNRQLLPPNRQQNNVDEIIRAAEELQESVLDIAVKIGLGRFSEEELNRIRNKLFIPCIVLKDLARQ